MLGQGGMGSVWQAEHLGLRAPVAVKLMDPLVTQNADALARFHREAHAAAMIRSPHVVQVLDHGVDEATHTPFIVMELLERRCRLDLRVNITRDNCACSV
jgi:serine/threonine-protein kinase